MRGFAGFALLVLFPFEVVFGCTCPDIRLAEAFRGAHTVVVGTAGTPKSVDGRIRVPVASAISFKGSAKIDWVDDTPEDGLDVIAFVHQHQRPLKTQPRTQHTQGDPGQALQYIEATLEDIALANRIAHEVLGRNVSMLMPPESVSPKAEPTIRSMPESVSPAASPQLSWAAAALVL